MHVDVMDTCINLAGKMSHQYVTYSPHIVQIADFWEFLHANCEEKSETFTEFQTNLVLTRNIKIIRRYVVVVKIQQKRAYDREFSIVKSGGQK